MTLGRAAACLATLVILAAPCAAQDAPADIYEAATRAYHEGQKCLSRGRKPGANQFLENEKALGHLEQSQRLMEKYLAVKEDPEAERMMSEILSLLFWCHKMSPMVDPEEIEPEDPEPQDEPKPEDPPEEKPAGEDDAARQAAAEAARRKRAEEAAQRAEGEARKLFDEAVAYREANAEDGMGALAKFFYVAERFPKTASGQKAQAEAEKLQGSLFAVKPVVPKKAKRKPLTSDDKRAIEKQLKGWLSNRMKVRCASCKGAGFSECKACDGTGKVSGRAGRKSTCRKCKRGKVYCKRRSCSEGIDTRMLEKVVIDARAPYYQEKLKALLGGGKNSLDLFLEALAANLSGSARAPAAISRCATDLGIAPVQLRDIIETHGPGPSVITPFKAYSLEKIDRKTTYQLKGDSPGQEAVTFEQTPEGEWFLRDFK